VEVVASLSQGRTAAAQCGLFTYKSVPVIFEPTYTRLDKIRNEVIRKELEISGTQDVRAKYKQNWINHLERTDST